MTKRTAIFLMILFALLAVIFCLMTIRESIQGGGPLNLAQTATYGAEQFHVQLTAVAGQQ